jgi:hypothetical protein
MRGYSIFKPQMWCGETGRRIRAAGPVVMLVAVYSFTSPHASWLGLYYISLPTMMHEIGVDLDSLKNALATLANLEFAYYDFEMEIMWVPSMAKHQIAETLSAKDSRVVGIARDVIKFKKAKAFYAEFMGRYRAAFHLDSALATLERTEIPAPPQPPVEGASTPPPPLNAPSTTRRGQEQEQEQEHEQEGIQGAAHPSGGGKAGGGLFVESPAESRKQSSRKKSTDPLPPLPIELQTEKFRRAWADWQQHRREIRKPLKPTAAAQQIKQFLQWGTESAIAAIEYTILKGWVGIRQPEKESNNGHANGKPRPDAFAGRPKIVPREFTGGRAGAVAG